MKRFGPFLPVIALVAITSGLILTHHGGLLNLGFPLLAGMTGLVLFVTRRSFYLAFVWWIWLFTPEVRRLVDFQSGYHVVSLVLTTPLAVTSFAGIAVLKRPQVLLWRPMAPLLAYLVVLMYGFGIGAILNGLAPAGYDLANSLVPLVFGIYLISDRKRFEENRIVLIAGMISGLLMTSLYGLYQFFYFPPWDAFWLQNAHVNSLGTGAAEQVRLFGPLNSELPYGIALMVPLAFALVTKGPFKIAATVVGIPAFGLSLVRSAWGGWVIAAAFLLARAGGKTRGRVIIVSAIALLLAGPLLSVGPISSILSKRLATFSNIQNDGSFISREALYESFFVDAFSHPIGAGLGANGLATRLSTTATASFDSGILEIPVEFGWAGGGILFWSLIVLVKRVLLNRDWGNDSLSITSGGLFLSMVAQNIFTPSLSGILGMALWASFGLAGGPVFSVTARSRSTPAIPIDMRVAPALST